jgi:hypothetical protein
MVSLAYRWFSRIRGRKVRIPYYKLAVIIMAKKEQKLIEEPAQLDAATAEIVAKALEGSSSGQKDIPETDIGNLTMNHFTEMMDKLLSSLHLRQKTNLKPLERNGLAALDAQLVHTFERRGYVDTVLKMYCDSFREHSVSLDDTGGKRIVSAIQGAGGSSPTNITQMLPPQVQSR